jgi:hypothetical protein
MFEPSGSRAGPPRQERARRPSSVAAVAVGLAVVALLSAVVGFALSAVSSCCGSPDPADPTAAVLGVGVALPLAAAAVGLWSGRLPRLGLLLCAAALPVAMVAASPSSSDLAGLLPFTVLGWLWLVWYLRRPTASGWLAERSRS